MVKINMKRIEKRQKEKNKAGRMYGSQKHIRLQEKKVKSQKPSDNKKH